MQIYLVISSSIRYKIFPCVVSGGDTAKKPKHPFQGDETSFVVTKIVETVEPLPKRNPNPKPNPNPNPDPNPDPNPAPNPNPNQH